MTSQVAVMNLKGIAIASDTVVTLSSGSKTMGNTPKIYEIGESHKVLVMHSGGTELNDSPVALYVSEWGRTIPTPLPALQDYVESFTKWVGRESSIHQKGSEVGVMTSVLQEHFKWVQGKCQSFLSNTQIKEEENERAFKKRIQDGLKVKIQEGLDFLNRQPTIKGFSLTMAQKALEDSNYDLDNWVDYYFGEMKLSPSNIELMKSSASLALTKWQSLDNDSTLAFVGFGAEEPYCGTIKVTCRGIYAGGLKSNVDERFGVATDDKTGIVHFAQGDAIAAFLRGYNWKISDKVNQLYRSKMMAEFDIEGSEEAISKIIDEVDDALSDYSHEEFVSPMLSTINAMSLHSLGEFAESLVGLQATATYAKSGPATVGGLIEVATIDRTSGIRWIKALDSRLP